VWPAVILAVLLVLGRFVLPPLMPPTEYFSLPLGLLVMFGGMFCGLAIFLWWILFSRVRWMERVAALVLIVLAVVALRSVADVSIVTGAMGNLLYVLSFPIFALALVAWAVIAGRLADGARRIALIVAIALACVPWLMLRTSGMSDAGAEFHWRWTPTPEQKLLAKGDDASALPAVPETPPAPPASATPAETPKPAEAPAPAKPDPTPHVVNDAPAEWPGFRGPNRDSIIHGVTIDTDWTASPPKEMWRRPIGPGWSSFSVRGDVLYTQEQRGDDEIVAAYRVSNGQPVWRHRDRTRFWESNGGAGPRATPTLHAGRLYAFGATGLLNVLDATTGAVLWSHDVSADAKTKVPMWGFASSPLIVNDVVIVAASGTLAAYDAVMGKLRWVGPHHTGTYSSPHLVTIDGVEQVVLLTPPGAIAVKPSDGTLLWEHKWEGASIVQPAVLQNGDVLINAITSTGGIGMRRVSLVRDPHGWRVEERWTSTGLKPYFNDFVVHKGYAYGFDGSILACIDIADGARKWKGGRYGSGQLVLLPDQDLLLVLSEDGELALVKATPDQFSEVARFKAIEGKTWNHPVLVQGVLLVRNGEEMAAFRLSERQ
jgi:outer membrane protein assembly factor BamB